MLKKRKWLLIIALVFLAIACFFLISSGYTVPILMYHSIGYREGSFFVTPENFNRQMEYIKKKGYEVITLDRLVRSIRDKEPLKRNKVVITFDDGYRDNFKYAYPVLKKFNFSATVFLVTDFMGRYFEGSGNEFMKWDEVSAMSKGGISFGGHTKTHLDLGLIKDEARAFAEIAGSKKAIEDRIGTPADFFCYPSGAFNEAVKELVARAGYKGACTTNRGFTKFNRDVYELKRIKVTNSDTHKPFSFWAKLSGYYNIFKKGKKPY